MRNARRLVVPPATQSTPSAFPFDETAGVELVIEGVHQAVARELAVPVRLRRRAITPAEPPEGQVGRWPLTGAKTKVSVPSLQVEKAPKMPMFEICCEKTASREVPLPVPRPPRLSRLIRYTTPCLPPSKSRCGVLEPAWSGSTMGATEPRSTSPRSRVR
ncbi:MAG: hypothetical protein R3A48_03740 [Polyangiales bacterium]